MELFKKLTFIFLIALTVRLAAQEESSNVQRRVMDISPQNLISVSIGGDFFINGTFSAFINERLDHFLTRVLYASIGNNSSNEDEKSQTNYELSELMAQSIKRNIKIIKSNGEEKVVDIEKYYLTGDLKQNPYMQQDDLIIFPKINIETNYIIVDGAVNKRLKFPFVKGDKLNDALLFAHGVDSAYKNVEYAEIVRISYDGKSTIRDTISLKSANSYSLYPGDIVRVIGDSYERKDYKVLVVGEVKKPGYIYISKQNTTLSEVLYEAGGVKESAWLEYSELLRGTTPEKKVMQELIVSSYDKNKEIDNTLLDPFRFNVEYERWKMYRTANLYDDYIEIFKTDADLALLANFKFVDFTKLNDPNSEESNFIVEDGDVIYIPKKMDLVNVMGQVVKPGHYPYKIGYGYLDYIKIAGGFSEAADDETEVYILKGKAYNWVKVSDIISIEPGDYIWVKKDPARSFNFYLYRISSITGIVGSIATIVLLVSQLVK